MRWRILVAQPWSSHFLICASVFSSVQRVVVQPQGVPACRVLSVALQDKKQTGNHEGSSSGLSAALIERSNPHWSPCVASTPRPGTQRCPVNTPLGPTCPHPRGHILGRRGTFEPHAFPFHNLDPNPSHSCRPPSPTALQSPQRLSSPQCPQSYIDPNLPHVTTKPLSTPIWPPDTWWVQTSGATSAQGGASQEFNKCPCLSACQEGWGAPADGRLVCTALAQTLGSSKPQGRVHIPALHLGSLSILPERPNYWGLQSPSVDTVAFSLHTHPGKCVLSSHFTGVRTKAQQGEVRHLGTPN